MTPDQRTMVVDSLTAGCSLADALRGAGVARKAFAEACAADRDYERACDAAREAGQRAVQALRVESVGVAPQADDDGVQPAPREPGGRAAVAGFAKLPNGGGGEAEHEGGERVHAPQRAPAATAAQGSGASRAGPVHAERGRLGGEGRGNAGGSGDLGATALRSGGVAAASERGASDPHRVTLEHGVHGATDDAARVCLTQAPAWAAAVRASAALDAEEAPEPKRSKRASETDDTDVGKLLAFAEEAEATYGPGMFALYQHQDDRLVAAGIPRTSPWWLFTFATFFSLRSWQPLLQWIVALVGRGGGKSTTLEKLMLVVLLFTVRSVPPTETWQLPYISVRPIDARRRIYETSKLLSLAYGITVAPTQPLGTYTLALRDIAGNAVEIVSLASTIGNVSGPSTPGCVVDEAAKLQTNPQGANPDGELITSLAETSRARDGWIGVRCSSAWRTTGAHHASVTEGTNLVNFVPCIGADFIEAALWGLETVAAWEASQGNPEGAAQIRAWSATLSATSPNVPTWVANPTIPALRSRQLLDTLAKDDPSLEGLDRTTAWLRECASMPLAHDGGADYAAQCMLAASITARVAGTGGPRRAMPQVMPVRGAPPGDPRYAGPEAQTRGRRGSWRTRGYF